MTIDWVEQGFRVHACLEGEASALAEIWVVGRAEMALRRDHPRVMA